MPPVTIDGSLGITTPMYNGSITANAVTPSVNMKSRIINGAMVIDQRNAGASVTPSNNQYITDRWKINYSGNFNCQQNAGSVTPPAGFTNYLGATATGTNSPTGATTYSFVQSIEGYNVADLGWGTSDAKTVTLSFWVRSSATGTFGGSVQNSASNRSYPFGYTISSAGTWEQKTVTIAGDTTGTWVKDNGIGLFLTLCMGGGASYVGTAGAWGGADYRTVSGQTNALAASTNYFYITGVQLEVGSTATSFDYRPYGTELALCQRYFVSYGGSSSTEGLGVGALFSTTQALIVASLPVEMRTAPILGFSAVGDFSLNDGSTQNNATALAIDGAGTKTVGVNVTSTGMTLGRAARFRCGSTSARLTYSAEL